MFTAHPRESNTEADRKNLEPQLGPYIHHKWHTDTSYEIDLVKVQDMGLNFYQIFSYAVVHFGDVPAQESLRTMKMILNGNLILQSPNTDGQTKELLQEEDAEVNTRTEVA